MRIVQTKLTKKVCHLLLCVTFSNYRLEIVVSLVIKSYSHRPTAATKVIKMFTHVYVGLLRLDRTFACNYIVKSYFQLVC